MTSKVETNYRCRAGKKLRGTRLAGEKSGDLIKKNTGLFCSVLPVLPGRITNTMFGGGSSSVGSGAHSITGRLAFKGQLNTTTTFF